MRCPSGLAPTKAHAQHTAPWSARRHAQPQHVSAIAKASRGASTLIQGQVHDTAALDYSVRLATSPAELRAAAYLRAQSFYVYPSDRSEWAARVGLS